MSWENALLMSNDVHVEKYEIEVTKIGQNYSTHYFIPAGRARSARPDAHDVIAMI